MSLAMMIIAHKTNNKKMKRQNCGDIFGYLSLLALDLLKTTKMNPNDGFQFYGRKTKPNQTRTYHGSFWLYDVICIVTYIIMDIQTAGSFLVHKIISPNQRSNVVFSVFRRRDVKGGRSQCSMEMADLR